MYRLICIYVYDLNKLQISFNLYSKMCFFFKSPVTFTKYENVVLMGSTSKFEDSPPGSQDIAIIMYTSGSTGAYIVHPSPQYIAIMYTTGSSGAQIVHPSPQYIAIMYTSGSTGAQIVHPSPYYIAIIMYTSGSTGLQIFSVMAQYIVPIM